MNNERQVLVKYAMQAKELSYSPYSKFRVGSALKVNGRMYLGANIENASYSLTTCAERVAIQQAHMANEDLSKVTQIAIVSDSEEFISPCGACRQVMVEMLPGETEVLMVRGDAIRVERVKHLLPGAFGEDMLANNTA